jgi:hypothetical protein
MATKTKALSNGIARFEDIVPKRKNESPFGPEDVVFDLDLLRARDMAAISKISDNPSKSWEAFAGILARVVVSAPGLDGDLADAETWLDVSRADFEAVVKMLVEELQGKN